MILSRFTAMPENAPHYESDLAHISFEQDALKICYQSSNSTSISILYSDITTVEHSDQLHCFRLAFTGNVEGTTNGVYHLLYMEDERVPVFVKMLAEHTKVPVQFLNRFQYCRSICANSDRSVFPTNIQRLLVYVCIRAKPWQNSGSYFLAA